MHERVAAVLDRHESSLPVGLPQISRVNAASGLARSRFVAHQTIFFQVRGYRGHHASFSALPLVLNPDTDVTTYYCAAHGVEVRCSRSDMRSILSVPREHDDKHWPAIQSDKPPQTDSPNGFMKND
jgi:hypothetical protein